MNAREAIAQRMKAIGAIQSSEWTDLIEQWLDEEGFVILPKSDVEAIRNKALEEAAVIVDCNCRKKKRPCDEYDCPREQADEIRKLKSGGE